VAPPVFKTGLAGIAFAGGFDSLPPPPLKFSSGARPRPTSYAPIPAARVGAARSCQRRWLAH